MSEHWLFVVNPAAGNGAGEVAWELIEKALRDGGIPYLAEFPSGIDAAARLIHLRSIEPIRGVVAVGGDGTVHGVINGVMNVSRAGGGQLPVGIIPVGQLNDFAHNFPLPIDKALSALRRVLNSETTRTVDVGMLTSPALAHPLYFGNGVIIGLEPRFADMRTDGQRLPFLSTLRYWSRHKAPTITVTYGAIARRAPLTLLAYTNGRRHLGGFSFAPTAAPDDGQMELTLIRAVSALTATRLLLRADKGAPLTHVAVTQESTPELHLESDAPIPLLLDGESLNLPLRDVQLSIQPGAVRLLL